MERAALGVPPAGGAERERCSRRRRQRWRGDCRRRRRRCRARWRGRSLRRSRRRRLRLHPGDAERRSWRSSLRAAPPDGLSGGSVGDLTRLVASPAGRRRGAAALAASLMPRILRRPAEPARRRTEDQQIPCSQRRAPATRGSPPQTAAASTARRLQPDDGARRGADHVERQWLLVVATSWASETQHQPLLQELQRWALEASMKIKRRQQYGRWLKPIASLRAFIDVLDLPVGKPIEIAKDE